MVHKFLCKEKVKFIINNKLINTYIITNQYISNIYIYEID